jgi:archaellum component FlaG (FlaF/FlaG flagellin family)
MKKILTTIIAAAAMATAQADDAGHQLARTLRSQGHEITAYAKRDVKIMYDRNGFPYVERVFVHIYDHTTGKTYAITSDGQRVISTTITREPWVTYDY